jgi:phosphatidylglycerophosphate synthase
MNLGAEWAELREQFREHPRVVVRGLGELATVAVLLVGTFALLTQGVTASTRPFWVALVVLGTAFVLLPTLIDPFRQAYRRRSGASDGE